MFVSVLVHKSLKVNFGSILSPPLFFPLFFLVGFCLQKKLFWSVSPVCATYTRENIDSVVLIGNFVFVQISVFFNILK